MSIKNIILIILSAVLTASCTAPDESSGASGDASLSSTPVLFTSGTSEGTVTSRATAAYMPQGGRFVCRMYYKGSATGTDYNGFTTAWLQVNNDKGNSVYRQNTFVAPTDTDDYAFDKNAAIFYWQNRKPHIFIALADYNKLNTDDGSTGTLKMEEPTMLFDLRRTDGIKSIDQQQDIIQARTVMIPSQSTQEANRVNLIFKHCFSKVQVNIKASQDAGLDDFTAANIDKVELLGVADTAYVYHINVNDTLDHYDTAYVAPKAKTVLATNYPKSVRDKNSYCTSIEMFKASTATAGYLTTHDVITFGNVEAIRITWHENENTGGVIHTMTRKITAEEEKVLRSGYRNIFNFELKRGTLAIINAEILPWETGTKYEIDGTIQKES